MQPRLLLIAFGIATFTSGIIAALCYEPNSSAIKAIEASGTLFAMSSIFLGMAHFCKK